MDAKRIEEIRSLYRDDRDWPLTAEETDELCRLAIAGLSKPGTAWVSAEDRLPDTDGRLCIVYLPERSNWKLRIDFEYYHAFEGWATDEYVSHWMPLPSEPSKD